MSLTFPLRLATSVRSSTTRQICRRCLATSTDNRQTLQPPPEDGSYDPTLPSSQRNYRLKTTDYFLKKPLLHRLPPQLLEHSTSPLLPEAEAKQRAAGRGPHKQIVGVVVSSGLMSKTVTVRVPTQRWERKLGKYFDDHIQHLVHDPNSSLVTGDVVSLHRLKVSKTVRHVVASVVSPFGAPLDARPPIPTADERLATYKEHRFNKLYRRSLRNKAALGNEEAGQQLQRIEAENQAHKKSKQRTKGQKVPQGVRSGSNDNEPKVSDLSSDPSVGT